MTNNYILAGDERQAQLEAAKAAFFASGGQAIQLGTYHQAPAPSRSSRIDPETVLKRRRPSPTRKERVALRQLAESL